MDGVLAFLGFLIFLAFVVSLFWGIARNIRKKSAKRQYMGALASVIAFVAVALIAAALYPVKETIVAKGGRAPSKHAPAATSAVRHATASPHTPRPHAHAQHVAVRPTPTMKPLVPMDRKAQFLSSVDESISIADVSGGPYKYIGQKVDLHGVVGHIVDPDTFNIADDNGDTVVVIGTDTSSLQAGQPVRIVGVVSQPIAGTNLAGGSENFAAVTEYFMQCSGGSLDLQC